MAATCTVCAFSIDNSRGDWPQTTFKGTPLFNVKYLRNVTYIIIIIIIIIFTYAVINGVILYDLEQVSKIF